MGRFDRVQRATVAAYVVAASGAGALLAFAFHSELGQPFGTLTDALLLVMTLAIAPLMLGSYELGGITPLWPARFSLGAGIGAVLVWSVAQAAVLAGLVTIDPDVPATGVAAVEAVALLVMGAWITGAPPLAGPWLPVPLRWLGAIAGLGFIALGVGQLLGGPNQPLTYVGGLGYQVLFPIWAFLLARRLEDLRRA
jgi:hypothetical protein